MGRRVVVMAGLMDRDGAIMTRVKAGVPGEGGSPPPGSILGKVWRHGRRDGRKIDHAGAGRQRSRPDDSKERVMNTRDEYVRKMHSLLDKGSAEIDALEARAEHAEAEAREAYRKQIAALRVRQDEARARLESVRTAGEGAWQDLKAGVELAWEAIGEAIESAK